MKIVFKKIINIVFKITNAFNKEWHKNIEMEIIEASREFHQNDNIPLDKRTKNTEEMREFYYARMSNSSNLLLALSSFFISTTALIVSVISLIKSY